MSIPAHDSGRAVRRVWLIAGLALMVIGALLGLQGSLYFLYAGAAIGAGCIAWSIRLARRAKLPQPIEVVDPDLDQTCELNYRPE